MLGNKTSSFFFLFSFFLQSTLNSSQDSNVWNIFPASYFLWLSPPTPAALSDGYCFLVSSNYSNTAYLTAAAHTHTCIHTHTQSAHICLAEFRWEGRSKRNGSSRITQQNEIMSRTWFYLHEPSKMCVRSGLEVFDFIVLQWTPFFFYFYFFYCEALEPVSPQRELWSACFLFYESLSISRSC